MTYLLKYALAPRSGSQAEIGTATDDTGSQLDYTSLFKPLDLTPSPPTSIDAPTTSVATKAQGVKPRAEKLQLSTQQSSAQKPSKPRLLQGNQHKQVATKFKKISYYGDVLPDSALQWSCARDVKTNLLWETKLDNAGLSDADHRYSWYDPSKDTPGVRNGGKCYKIECDTHAYIREINRLKLCGSEQWRLPTFTELETLLDRAYFDPVINQEIFFNTTRASYWTQSQLEFNPETAMQIDFFNGTSSPAPLHYKLAVRLVSEPQNPK